MQVFSVLSRVCLATRPTSVGVFFFALLLLFTCDLLQCPSFCFLCFSFFVPGRGILTTIFDSLPSRLLSFHLPLFPCLFTLICACLSD